MGCFDGWAIGAALVVAAIVVRTLVERARGGLPTDSTV